MVNCRTLDSYLTEVGIGLFTGVPDSCFVPWVNYLLKTRKPDHIISTNEGEALSIAAGYNLSTGKTACVYLQNSGLGSLLNPLTSVTDRYVYKIPVLLMISWRGKPGEVDEPQHKRMGQITAAFLESIDVPYHVYNNDGDLRKALLNEFKNVAGHGGSYALLFSRGDIQPYPDASETTVALSNGSRSRLTRWDAVVSIAEYFGKDAVFFATTGKTSRELYFWRDLTEGDHSVDFLNVGGMGWVSALAFGFSLRTKKRVIVLDGDGSILMHMGNMATIGHYRPTNIIHFILDNKSHDSVGGPSTVSETVDFSKAAEAVGYRRSAIVSTKESLHEELARLKDEAGPILVTVRIEKGARPDLPRPSLTPQERKALFVRRAAAGDDSN
jgi:phosphonopyruvate decarboxylase